MKSAERRTGMYLYSSAAASAPRSVRAPQTTRPNTGKDAQAIDAERIEQTVFVVGHVRPADPATPFSAASIPAGAFHTPRCASVRAMTPAIDAARHKRIDLAVRVWGPPA